jgi:hypothetical protein
MPDFAVPNRSASNSIIANLNSKIGVSRGQSPHILGLKLCQMSVASLLFRLE